MRLPLHIVRPQAGKRQAGFFLIEALVIVILFAIVGVAFTKSVMLGYRMRQRMVHRAVALQIASDEMEYQARLRANGLAVGTTNLNINQGTMRFQQSTAIAAATAGGYTVTVTVTDLNPQIGGSVQLRNTLVPYGSS